MDFLLVLVCVLGFFLMVAALGDASERNRVRRRVQEAREFQPVAYENTLSEASARWASDKLLKAAGLFKGKGWRIGYTQSGRVLRYGGPGHLLLVAPPRSGKAVSVLVPALLDQRRGSCIVIDPKGELCAITSKRAKNFGDVVALDPFGHLKKLGVKGVKVVGLNPLASLDPKSVAFGGDVASLTDAIVWDEEGGDRDRHWTDSARQLVGAVIRVLVKYGKPEEKNLVAVREKICGDIFGFARKYVNCGDTVVRQALARYTTKFAEESRELNSVISTAVTQTDIFAVEGISGSLMAGGLRFADVKRKRMTVYIILPLDKLTSCGKWFRLCMAAVLGDLLKAGPGGLPVMCIIDELFSIGPLKALEAAMSQAAGAASLQLMLVLQSLAQLEAMYPRDGGRNFQSNTAVKIFFGGYDWHTAKNISEMCGRRETVYTSRSVREDRNRKIGGVYDVDVSDSASVAWEELVRPHEVCRMHDREMIVFCEKVAGPIWAKRKPYFEGWEFRGQYGRNPYYNGGGWVKGIFGR
jgi:type IV secretion system protein VirD4